MKTSNQARRDGKLLFRSCLVEGVLEDARVRQAVSRVLAEKPRGYSSVLAHFRRLLKLHLEQRTARIESAQPLDAGRQAGVLERLARLYGPGLDASFAVNPALIGGLRVQVGSDVFDGSIRTRLAELQTRF